MALFVVYFVTRWSDRHHERGAPLASPTVNVFGCAFCLSAHGSPVFVITALVDRGLDLPVGHADLLCPPVGARRRAGHRTGIALVSSIGNSRRLRGAEPADPSSSRTMAAR